MNINDNQTTPESSSLDSARILVLYAIAIVAAIVGFYFLCSYGNTLPKPTGAASEVKRTATATHTGTLFHVLVALVAMITAGRLIGMLFRRIGQPSVIGEVVAGILLGPSLLGRFAPEVAEFILPASVAPFLAIIAQIAVILYMFLIGLEFDATKLQKRGHSALAISHFSIIAPFMLGGILALWLYPRLGTVDVPFDDFALFLGISMSVTAFPVLARILIERGIQKTELGIMALTCAAADDVTAWCLLAFVVAFTNAQEFSVMAVVVTPLIYLAVMFFIVRPILVRILRLNAMRELNQNVLAVIFIALLLSSLTTEWIGIHAIFGAFILGAIIPSDNIVARELPGKLQNIVVVLLLPAFFAITGMRTKIGLVDGTEAWLICGFIILVATLGKFGGTFVAAKITGYDNRDSAALGALMNTRGLMELIVLNVGLDLGVISPTLFAMLVIMALVTTLMTAPALRLLGTKFDRTAEI
jgi:Kef-type K+ transport system membrane component KefB